MKRLLRTLEKQVQPLQSRAEAAAAADAAEARFAAILEALPPDELRRFERVLNRLLDVPPRCTSDPVTPLCPWEFSYENEAGALIGPGGMLVAEPEEWRVYKQVLQAFDPAFWDHWDPRHWTEWVIWNETDG